MQFNATNTIVQSENEGSVCLHNLAILSTVSKKLTAFGRRKLLPAGFLLAFLFSGSAAMAQGCPSPIEGSVLTASTNPICSGQMTSINISVSPGSGGTYSGSFTNGRTFTGLTPTANTIKPTYTFTNSTTGNITEYFELRTLTFTTSGGATCNATSMTGNTTLTIQPVADLNAMLTTPPILCNNGSVSINVSNPNGVGGTYNRSTNYGNAGHTATTPATGQAYGTFTDVLTNGTSSPITVVYTFTPVSPGSGCVGTPVNVSVVINPNPTITCPANKTVSTDPSVCTAVVTGIDPTFTPATCNGSAPTVTYSATGATSFTGTGSASGKTFNKGITTVTYNIKDAANNTGTPCSFTVTVNDNEAPLIAVCPSNISVPNDVNQCGAVVTFPTPPANSATDNCGGAVTYTFSPMSGSTFPIGVTTVTFTATDNATPANSSTCTFTVTVNDTQVPVISFCPGNITINNANDDCGAVATFAATASDNCPGFIINYSQNSGTVFPVGTTTVTATAVDAAGNTSAVCSFTVTVINVGGIYVNDAFTAGSDTYTTAAGDDVNGNGTKCKPFATITKAISVASFIDTIYVDAGSYTEEVTINKQLTIKGSNAGKDPTCNGTGHTLAPTVFYPVTNNNDATTANYSIIMSVAANNVVIDGFTLDGDNPAQAGTYNAAVGIAANSGQAGLDIKNNIVQNLMYAGADLTSANGVMTSGNTIRNNKFNNISPLSGFGIGVTTGNNTYADIMNNCMDNVRKGIQGGENNYVANVGNVSPVWSGNTIRSYRIGIWNNLAYGAATPVTITNNTITTIPGSTINRGIEISSLQGTVSVTVSGNTIGSAATATMNGIYLWNNPTSNTVTISANTLTNCDYGVFATNRDASFGDAESSTYVLNGITITSGNTGIYVQDSTGNTNNATVAVQVQNNTAVTNTVEGLIVSGASSSANFNGATPAIFTAQSDKYIILKSNGADVPATNIDATAVTFDGQTGSSASPAQNFAIEDKINHKIDFLPLGFVTVRTANAFVTDITPLAPTATNNDYTRIRNGILAASTGFTINHDGTFNWAETNAAASWALGNDGLTGTTATSNDDYSILIPNNLNSVTFTTPSPVTPATIQGPGDLANANLEGVLVFDGTVNQGWTISNMKFQDFDLSIGMFNGAGGVDAFDNTTITNNFFRIPKDLNSNAAPSDPSQNIGIHYSFGSSQTISNNTFEVDGTGVSNGTTNLSTSNVMQSNTSGGATTYDGLQITGNTITVTGVPAMSPNQSVIRGIWENSQSTGAAINISSNKFSNTATGNTADLNRQTAFWVTSSSDASKKVTYRNNEVSGYRDGIAWLGGLFTSNTPPDYNMGETPTEIMNNKFDGVQFGVVVRKSGASSNPGSPALINYNSFTNTPSTSASPGYAISNEASGTTNATCNWYGTVGAGAIAALINGPVTYVPYLLDGTDNDLVTRGFQTTAACGRVNALYVNDNSQTGDHYTTAIGNDNNPGTPSMPFATIAQATNSAAPGDTIYVDAGTFTEDYVFLYQKQTIRGSNYGIDPNTGTRLAESIVQPTTPDPTSGVLVYIDPAAAGSRFDGFSVDGTNTAYGIYAYTNTAAESISNDTISNNIIKNIGADGVLLYPNSNSPAGTGNIVAHNRFEDILQDPGTAILIYNNAYTNITDNVMNRVRIGVQTGNFYRADPGNSHTISNNTIQSQALGIWANLHYNAAPTFNINNNTLTNYPSASPVQSIGLRVQSIQGTTGVTVSNNNVSGNMYGVALLNCPTSSTITVNGGTLSGNAVGVLATNALNTNNATAVSSNYAINGVNIQNATYAGIEVNDTSLHTGNATVALSVSGNTIINNGATGLLIQGEKASASFTGATPATFTGQSLYINQISNGTDVPATNIDATAVTFDGQTGASASPAQNFAIEDKINHKIDFLPLGFVTVRTANAFVTDIAPLAPTPTNNDYTRIRNGILAASTGFTINHDGNFNWTEANAAASWALGNDGLTGTTATSNDDYSILIPNNLNSVTFTTPSPVTPATIQGPGDLPNANLEGVLVFDGTFNQGWTISNMKFQDFDLSIGMYNGAGGTDAFDNTTITNNFFRISKDLNAVAAPSDPNQNIGIHYSFGSSQTISNNTFEVDGTGVGNGSSNSTSIVMQSNTSGGATTYDGLKIINNTITVTGVPDATAPAVIRGIWENSNSTGAAIEISGNKFTNAAAGNTANLNRQTAFWVTSNSDAIKKVTYKNNEVSGFRDGVTWLGGLYTSNTPPDYNTGETEVEVKNNKFDGVQFGVVVRKSGASTNPGSPAIINDNSFTNPVTGGFAISNEGSGTTNATCNWYGTTTASTIATYINGPVTYVPYRNDGTDGSTATGFQPTTTCLACTNAVTATATQTTSTCAGNNDGVITASAPMGGNGPYTFTIAGPTVNTTGASSGVFTSLSQGTYTITIFEATGCSTVVNNVIVKDQVAPMFTNCPAPVTGQTPNMSGCQASLTPPAPMATDNCTPPVITYVLSNATTGNGTAPIGAMNFNVGTTIITYTATDQSGNTATCTTSVTVVNNQKDSISGTATVVQNNATTSNITFYASGGTGPYTFTYNVRTNGGSPGPNQTVNTTGNNTIVTVPQSNAVVGQYIYTLVSGTDMYGCPAAIASDFRDTITVTATSTRPDFVSSVPRPVNSAFINAQVKDGYVQINNVATVPSTGQITFRISNMNNFMFTFPANMTTSGGDPVNNSDWIITPGAFFYTVTSKPGTVINGGTFSRVGFTLTATGNSNSQGIMTVTILNDTGGSSVGAGDDNNTNNQSVKLFTIN